MCGDGLSESSNTKPGEDRIFISDFLAVFIRAMFFYVETFVRNCGKRVKNCIKSNNIIFQNIIGICKNALNYPQLFSII